MSPTDIVKDDWVCMFAAECSCQQPPVPRTTATHHSHGHLSVRGYDDEDDDEDGYPAHSHHDKFPPWWDFVRDDDGGNLSVTKYHH